MSFYPGFALANQRDFLWLNIEPYKVNDLKAMTRDAIWDKEKIGDEMSFAIVENWDERIAHTWEKFDSMTSKVLEKFVSIGSAITQLNGAVRGAENALSAKVDEALVYKDSPRRAMTFTLNLAAYNNPRTEVVDPVKKLQKYSCASTQNGNVMKIEWPYIFDINISTLSGDKLLRMKEAALTNVDVTWKMPFMKKGNEVLPGVASLVVTFIEMNPLYQGNFDI